ncbi:MAG: TMEM175 family protein [Rudaea sp.]
MSTSVSSVLRIRRHQPTRLEGFVDSAFAFAVTLLVISVGHIPESVPAMLQALRGIPAFAACFLLIARFWQGHRAWGRHYDIEDRTAVTLGILLVFLVLIYVYPLRFLFAASFASMSGGWLADQPIRLTRIDDLRTAYIVFGLGYAAIALVFVLLYRHAYRLREYIGLDAGEAEITRRHMYYWCGTCIIALLSCVLAFALPFDRLGVWSASVPGCCYLLIFVLVGVLRQHSSRRLAALAAAHT